MHLSNGVFVSLRRKRRPKHFEAHWMKNNECFKAFDKLWIPDPHPSVDSVCSNLGSILDHLLVWIKKKHGNLPLKTKQVKEKLDTLRSQSSWLSTKEVKLEMEFKQLSSLEEDYWKASPGLIDLQKEIGTQLISLERHLRDKSGILSPSLLILMV